ncbi:MAG: hypothetical protein QN168_07280 [Armatimonadota bacterium]|nr:hypothetical protein [Armatimonadota bacterium]
MRTLRSWAVFVAAVVSFSRLWQGVRAALEGGRLYGPLEALFWMGLFLGSMGYLAFLIYAADRAAGRTRRPMPLFDRLLDRRTGTGEVGARGR